MTTNGGSANKGVLFSIDPANNNQYAKLVDFVGSNGSNPYGGLMELQSPTTVESQSMENHFIIAPNPGTDQLNVQLHAHKAITIFVTNALGELAMTGNEQSININALAPGIYFVKVTDKDGRWIGVERFVKN
jgi:hypothetical protein